MKVMAGKFSNALYHITLGWQNVLTKIGVDWVTWNPEEKPAFDAFSEYEPDIFIGTTYDLDRATIKCIKARPNMKVVLKANNWGRMDDEIDTEKFPIGVSDFEEQTKITQLREEVGKPDLVFNFYHKNWMEPTMGLWDENGVPTIDLQPAADIYSYYPTDPDPTLKCDIAFVGGYWKYKAINIDPYILPLCYPVDKYNIKIFGNQIWPVPQYMGLTDDATANRLFSSAIVCPNVSEPHANEYGFEVNERVFKLAACKAFCVSDYIESLDRDIFDRGEMLLVDSAEEFHDAVHEFGVRNPHLREHFVEAAYDRVMAEHTYHHRMANLLTRLGFEDKAKEALELLNNVNE